MIIVGQKSNNQIYGGVEKYVFELSNFLARHKEPVTLLNRKGYLAIKPTSRNIKFIQVPTIHSKYLDGPIYSFLSAFYCIGINDKIINVQGIGPAFFLPLFKILNPSKKIIFTFHCRDYFQEKWSSLGKIFLKAGEYLGCKLSDYVITVSSNLANYVKNKYGIKPIVIKNALELKLIYSTKNNPSLFKKLKIEKYKYFLVISRLVKHKNIEIILKQFATQKMSPKRNFKLVIVGDEKYENQYKAYLKNLVIESNAKDKIIFTGKLKGNYIYKLIKYARGILSASSYEGLSYALIEAAAFGKPILCRSLPSNKEILDKYGYYFNKNKRSFILQVNSFIKNCLKKNAVNKSLVNRIKKFFNADKNFQKILEILNNL